MLLNQLVRINEEGLVADAVNFGMMAIPEKNLLLCGGFIFNYDPNKPKQSTLGVLDAVRRSYHSRNEANVHLIVQGYGTGKSHFGLVLANFFKQPSNSLEVQGILKQVEIATSSNSKAILQDLKAYKQRSNKHLVICIRGDDGLDLKQMFLRSLRHALEAEGIAESLAQQVCHTPLRYLEGLTPEQRANADKFLERTENSIGDVNALIELLRQDNYRVIATVKALSRELTGGYPIDFEADLKIEAILEELLNTLCAGENSRFQGILILFDELNYYLQSWATNPVAAGGPALQSITNVCENHKGKIALVCFTQIKPSNARAIPYQSAEDYRKLTSRLELSPSTYEPASSLELVIKGLLSHRNNSMVWQEFRAKWNNTLRADSANAYEKRIPASRHQRKWSFQEFHDNLTLSCFPLHSLTSYLLCNLDFTQGRTAIQFIKNDVKDFILEQPVEKNNQLNYIYPVVLVNTFEDNFSNYSIFAEYKRSYDSIVASATPDEITVLQALFLFYASGDKLSKSDKEKHEDILIQLTGISLLRVKEALETLCQTREVIYQKPEDNTYRFYSGGVGLAEIRQKIEEEISEQPVSINKLELHCQGNIIQYLGSKAILANQFVEDNKLIVSDWLFECKIYIAERFTKAVLSEQTLRNIEERGIVAYIIAETSEELLTFRNSIERLLSQSPIKSRVVVAIPSQPTDNLAQILLMLDAVKNKSSTTRQQLGAALTQLQQQLQQQLDKRLTDMFKSCTYHCSLIDKIPSLERNNPPYFVSALLQNLYCFVPPVEKIDKMALKSAVGSEVIGYVSKRLLDDDLSPHKFPKQSYENVVDPIFVRSWGMLRKASQRYSVVEPNQRNVKAAWDKISEMTALNEHSDRTVEIARIWETLSQPPYGYNEYTFTILFAGWLAHHRAEVALRGGFGIPQKKSEKASVYTRPIKDWATINILDKPKDFIHEWVEKGRPQLIRRQPSLCPEVPDSVDYDEAQQLIKEIDAFLNSGIPDPIKVSEISKKKEQLNAGIEQIETLLQPVIEAARLTGNVNIEPLIRLMPSLLQQLPQRLGVATVRLTEQQRNRQAQVLQAVGEKIEEIINIQSERYKSLTTEEACGAYKTQIQATINQVNQASGLPSRLIGTLQDALRAAESRLVVLKEQAKVKECLSQIQKLGNALSDYATQQDYTRTRSEIETLAQDVPAVREEEVYRQVLQDLEQRYNHLTQQVEIWEKRFTGIERSQALELVNEINRQHNRFTSEVSKQRLNTLLAQLNDIVLDVRSQEEAENSVKAVLVNSEQKLQLIQEIQTCSKAFEFYEELIQCSLPSTKQTIVLDNYQKRLEEFKAQGRVAIVQKINQVCNRDLNRVEEYKNTNDDLQLLQTKLDYRQDFFEFINQVKVATNNLNEQYNKLLKQQQDRQIIQAIRQQKATKVNTICLGEESISVIENLRAGLNYPNEFTTEVEQIIQSFRDKVVTYSKSLQSLRQRLSIVEDFKQLDNLQSEYNKLDFVFKDSAEYPAYQHLQAQIHYLREDLDRFRNLEVRRQQSNSIALCNEALQIISDEQPRFHQQIRFQPKLYKLAEQLHSQVQTYIQELEAYSQNLESLQTVKEAQKLQEEILKKSLQYSGEEERYKAILSEVSLLINLLQISEAGKADTLQSCQVQIDKLAQWRENINHLTPNLNSRVDSFIKQSKQIREQIYGREKATAKAWLENLKNQSKLLNQSTDRSKKLESANKLLKQIQSQRKQHTEMLTLKQQQSLDNLVNQCIEVQNQDRESKILVLFQELPREQRVSLHQMLAAYLPHTTEEFNG